MASRLLLDTNLLLLFVVGQTGTHCIEKHKRLQAFDEHDFRILRGLVAVSAGLMFCPNVISETSNLIRYVSDPLASRISETLKVIVSRVDEAFVSSASACEHQEYIRLGVTDAVLLILSNSGALLLTNDLSLYLAAIRLDLNAENYNYIRERREDFLP